MSTNKDYRITRSIDVTLTADSDGEFDAAKVTGLDYGYVTVDGLRRAGYTVELVDDPAKDKVGTIRRFTFSKDLIVKGGDDKWRYVSTQFGHHRVGEVLPEFPTGFSPTEVVTTP